MAHILLLWNIIKKRCNNLFPPKHSPSWLKRLMWGPLIHSECPSPCSRLLNLWLVLTRLSSLRERLLLIGALEKPWRYTSCRWDGDSWGKKETGQIVTQTILIRFAVDYCSWEHNEPMFSAVYFGVISYAETSIHSPFHQKMFCFFF